MWQKYDCSELLDSFWTHIDLVEPHMFRYPLFVPIFFGSWTTLQGKQYPPLELCCQVPFQKFPHLASPKFTCALPIKIVQHNFLHSLLKINSILIGHCFIGIYLGSSRYSCVCGHDISWNVSKQNIFLCICWKSLSQVGSGALLVLSNLCVFVSN